MEPWQVVASIFTIGPLALYLVFSALARPIRAIDFITRALIVLPVSLGAGCVTGAAFGLFWGVLLAAIHPLAGVIVGLTAFLMAFDWGFHAIWDAT